MMRDMDLIRSILLEIEKGQSQRTGAKKLAELLNVDRDIIIYHLTILEDAGFVENLIVQPFSSGSKIDYGWRLKWQGHEFVESVRDPEIWRKTKKAATDVGSWSISLLSKVAKGYIKLAAQEIGIPFD